MDSLGSTLILVAPLALVLLATASQSRVDAITIGFYQGSFATGTAGAIYDAGNLVLWWLGIPAMLFTAVMAYRRRSLGMALIVVAFAVVAIRAWRGGLRR